MKAKKFLSTIAILFIALFSGCANDEVVDVVGVCPIVISTIPVDGASDVPLNQIVTATFNEEMNPLTINQSTFTITAAGVPIAGTISYAGKVATFAPSSRLLIDTVYTGRFTTEVKDVDGNALQTDYVWTFTTDKNPRLILRDPDVSATNVALNKAITATFNMSMNKATLNNTTFTVMQGTTPVAGAISFNASGTMFTFTPNALLAEDKVYTVTVTTGATNVAGTELAANEVWTFKTSITPKVIVRDPFPGQTGVALNKVISVTFNMPMNPLTINTTTFTLKQNGIAVLGVIMPNASGTTFTFAPSVPLAANKPYIVTISTGAQNIYGFGLASNDEWSFTTLDLTPYVTARDPFPGETGVALNKVISATFNMPMNLLTVNATTFTVKQNGIAIQGTIMPNASGTTFTFTPFVPLAGNTLYTVTITTGAQNTSGIGLASDDVWNFRTLVPVIPPVNTANGLGFGVFGGSAGITNQGLFTIVYGSMGTTAVASAITGFTDGTNGDNYIATGLHNGLVTEGIYAAAPPPGTFEKYQIAVAGLNEATILYNSLSPASRPGGTPIIGAAGELGGLTLDPGTYTSASTIAITNGDLTLDAKGDPDAKWYFQAGSALTVGDAQPSSVKFLNGVGNPNNVYWYVVSAAVINYAGGGVMVGNIISTEGVTLSSPANSTTLKGQETILNGRAISLSASVTMVNTIINVPTN